MKNALILFPGTPLRCSMSCSAKPHPFQEDNSQYTSYYVDVGSAENAYAQDVRIVAGL